MNIVKVISNAFDSFSRRIVKISRFGNDDVNTGSEALPFGVDSSAPAGMRAIYSETDQRGDRVILGYLNRNQLAADGETRLFSLDSNGSLKFYIWLHSDGTCEFGGSSNHLTQYEALKTAFDQLKGDFNSHITAYNLHTHLGVTVGSGVTGITTPGSQSSADMSGAKLNNLKTQ